MAVPTSNVIRESRHLWVGGLPDQITEAELKDYFSKFGRIEGVKILPQKYPNIGVAAFIDFYDIKSAIDAKETKHVINGCELRTNFKAKPTEKFDGKKRPADGLLSTDKQENVRGSASTSGSSDEDTDSSSSTSSSGSLSESENKSDKKSSNDVNVLFLKVTELANRPERVLQDGLYYEFCRYSSQAIVRMYGEASEKKWAVVKYKKVEECREAYRQSQGMVLFGSKIRLAPLDTDDFPVGGRDHPSVHHSSGGPTPRQFLPDETDLQATRSLFVGNIPKNISIFELRDAFQRYGNVLDVEIKKMGGNATYGFVLYYDLMSAITAKQYMDGQNLRGNAIRVGFGKGTASKTLWIDGIERSTTKQKLEKHLVKYGKIVRLGIDHSRCCAMVQYETMESAKEALNGMKGTFLVGGKRILTDFANRDARAAFFSRIEEEERVSQSEHFQGSPMMFNQGMMGSDPRMMIPRPGMTPMMGMSRDSFHFQGPPMDYYYSPYMDDFFAGGRPPFGGGVSSPPGSRRFTHPQFGRGMDDYEDELRAFTRKREWERERDKRKIRKKHWGSSSDSQESDTDLNLRQKKRLGKSKDKSKKISKKDKGKEINEGDRSREKSEGDSDSNDSIHEEARLRATKKSRELREKFKKSKKKTAAKCSSGIESATEDEMEKKSTKPKKVSVKESETNREEAGACDQMEGTSDDKKQMGVDVKSDTISSESLTTHSVASPPTSSKLSVENSTELSVCSLPASGMKGESIGEKKGEDLEEQVFASLDKWKDDQSISDKLDAKAKLEPKSPQSPFLDEQIVEHVGVKVESDLSSGEDFKESDLDVSAKIAKKDEDYEPQPAPSNDPISDMTHQVVEVFHAKKMPPNTPEIDDPAQKYVKVDKVMMGKKEQKLPRRYQIGEDSRSHSRDPSRRREHKVHSRSDRRLHHPMSSLSPPPPFGRRRRYHSPQPPELERRRQRRGRPSSPMPNPYRKASRSPPGFPSSPPYKGRSPFSGSPPHRPRSPPVEHRGTLKRRYDSPPYDSVRGNLPRRWSPPSPHHYRPYIPSSPPRPRSPSGRRRPRHRTPSDSPTGRSPLWGSKREGSPSVDLGGRSSPHHSEDRHDVLLKRHGKRPVHVYSRSPSPISKSKARDINKSDSQDIKRIKLDESRSNETPAKQSKPSKMERSQLTHRTGLAQSEQKLHKQQQSAAQFTKSTAQTSYNDSDMKESHPGVDASVQQSTPGSQQDNLLDLLRRYPVMWQGHLMLKNDMAAVQLHFLSGNLQLAKVCLPQPVEQHTPSLRIAQRMRLEKTQLEGVEKRILNDGEHCLLLALPCGRDATDVHTQTNNLKNSLISYLIQKQAAGIINVQDPQSQTGYVLHIFPPCPFSQNHLSRVAPDLLSSASDNCHLMIVAATM